MRNLLVSTAALMLVSACKLSSSSDSGGQKPAATPAPVYGQPQNQIPQNQQQQQPPQAMNAPTSPFLTATIFQPPTTPMSQIVQTALTTKVNDESDFLLSDTSPSTSSCTQLFLNQARYAASGPGLMISYSADWTACMQSSVKTPGETITTASARMYAYFDCPGTDLSSYVGKPVLNANNFSQMCNGPRNQIMNATITIRINFNSGQMNGGMDLISQAAQMASDGGRCAFVQNGGMYSVNNCNYVSRSDMSNVTGNAGVTPTSNFTLTQAQNLRFQQLHDLYYTSGQKMFTINNWHGQMSYIGPNASPTWTATSTTGQSASGTFMYTPSTNLALTGSSNGMNPVAELGLPKFFH